MDDIGKQVIEEIAKGIHAAKVKLLIFSKSQVRILKWLTKAASTDEAREILTFVHSNVRLNAAWATDGFRVYATKTEGVGFSGSYKFHQKPYMRDGEIVWVEELVSPVPPPDVSDVFPKPEDAIGTFSINPRMLVEALNLFTKREKNFQPHSSVTVRFYGKDRPVELFGTVEQDGKLLPIYALIMPMHMGDNEKNFWRPEKIKEE